VFFYTAYNLGIHAQVPLQGLVAVSDAPQDITIDLGSLRTAEQDAPRNSNYFLGETPGVGVFLVRDGKKIVIEPSPGVDESLLGALLLGPIMAVLLRQRGFAVLHASSIATKAGAIAFMGDSGCGKSTLAEAFYSRGYGVITDDVMAVQINGRFSYVIPGYPSIKLFPHTALILGCDTSATESVHSQTEKRMHSVALGFPQIPLPLRRIYVLAGGHADFIEPLQPREVFPELVRNSRAVTLLRDSESRNTHLHQCAKLAAGIPVFRLRRRRVLSAIPNLVELIEEDLAQNN
jgi:hypothetical protein